MKKQIVRFLVIPSIVLLILLALYVDSKHFTDSTNDSSWLTPIPLELIGTRWNLEAMHGGELLAGTTITLEFETDEITGRSGCNYYHAPYKERQKPGSVYISFYNTVQLCHPEAIMEQEDLYYRAFQKAVHYHIDGDKLLMMDAAGETTLQYRRSPSYVVNPKGLKSPD